MPAPAAPFVELFQLASAAFAEGCGSLGDAASLTKDEGRPSLAYGYQVLTSGLIQLEALAKRYGSTPECSGAAALKPILTDPSFRAAASHCADKLDLAAPFLGLPGKRIAAVLRRWLETNAPAEARVLAMACDAAARMTKTKSGRAA